MLFAKNEESPLLSLESTCLKDYIWKRKLQTEICFPRKEITTNREFFTISLFRLVLQWYEKIPEPPIQANTRAFLSYMNSHHSIINSPDTNPYESYILF